MAMIHRPRARAGTISTRKTTGAIPAPLPLTRDLVVQSCLDRSVRRVEFLDRVAYDGTVVLARSDVVSRDDGRFFVDVPDTRPVRPVGHDEILRLGLYAQGITRIVVDAATIRREPRRGNARLIWEHRAAPVASRDRERILHHLAEHGPCTIGQLARRVTTADAMTTVCAMACDDLIDIDIDTAQLDDGTAVGLRR
jgi:hypothetical protein